MQAEQGLLGEHGDFSIGTTFLTMEKVFIDPLLTLMMEFCWKFGKSGSRILGGNFGYTKPSNK